MAYRLNIKKKNLLVSIHVISVVAWFGAIMCMLLLGFYLKEAANGEQLYYTLSSMHVIDENLIKYPAIATLITGILLSVWTQWGLLKYYWVIIKLVLTILTIILGILFMGDWTSFLIETAKQSGIVALEKQEFQTKWLSLMSIAGFNLLAMITMTFITYFKPFGKRRKSLKGKS